jgi:integrase
MSDYGKPHCRSWRNYERMYASYFEQWRSTDAGMIARADVAQWHSRLGQSSGLFSANRALELMSIVFNRSISWDLVDKNPTKGISKFRTQPRERFLQIDEFPRFFAALSTLRNEVMKDFFLMCLWTSARRGNVMAMAWDQVDLNTRQWRIPRTKNGSSQVVALIPEAIAVLKRRLEERKDSLWVFPTVDNRNATGHITKPETAWSELTARAGIADLRIHDLRRSLASWMAMTGANISTIQATLGHRELKSTQIYARLASSGQRKAMMTASSKIMEFAGIPAEAQEEAGSHLEGLGPIFQCTDERSVDSEEAAEIIGVSTHQLSNWRHENSGPPYLKMGFSVFYQVKALKAWMHGRSMEKDAKIAARNAKIAARAARVRGPKPKVNFSELIWLAEKLSAESMGLVEIIFKLQSKGATLENIASAMKIAGIKSNYGKSNWSKSLVHWYIQRHKRITAGELSTRSLLR